MYFAKKKKKKRGFTLIELLVVIAIIGILATIVIVNVNAARSKAQNTAVKGSLDALRAGAELYYDTNSYSYLNFCSGTDYAKAVTTIQNNNGGDAPYCLATADAYAVSATLRVAEGTNAAWCVDSTGKSQAIATELAVGTACP
ncbi:MAG: hypothetical protein A2175_01905 [Candidatus Nealsonbacteria bacterium RBG_13_42_11]|uniref:Type II secretion system protein GspG C-terminal domain-containing protein n=1 Tax=Candidatus Nealsonbacteria bacterium RBG_13_42_11 TaxID=1801663 RepID=A0A1G2DY39_9BACT|nr:MAG: hypothetical protein A2175_01905 [Candidatus Nealsonbacteria bacterium RBG_13_42_11]HJX32016.1 type II secretion system protein [Thermodesulfobacteriota bacterium]